MEPCADRQRGVGARAEPLRVVDVGARLLALWQLAERGLSRFGPPMSVLDLLFLGSSLPLRSFARLGCAASVRGLNRLGSSISVLDLLHVGCTLTMWRRREV